MTITIPQIDIVDLIKLIGVISFIFLSLISYIGLLVAIFFSMKYVVKCKVIYFVSAIFSPIGIYCMISKCWGFTMLSTVLIMFLFMHIALYDN